MITLYRHAQSLSPDPSYGRADHPSHGSEYEFPLFPHRALRMTTHAPDWAASLSLFSDPGPLSLATGAERRSELLLDFGTELDAVLELTLAATAACNVIVTFGESIAEAEGWVPGLEPAPVLTWHVPDKGTHTHRFDSIKAIGMGARVHSARGFRFIRLLIHDTNPGLILQRICAHSHMTFVQRRGDFQCSDPRLQRAWQTSVYTARLCTRPDTIWDGIKRDRGGWFGDARIIQQTNNLVWHEPGPAESMIASLPVDMWVNGVPAYSFDAIAMMKEHILAFGCDGPCIREAYPRMVQFLHWVRNTQLDENGFITRSETLPFFGGMGFLDWSPMPCGGRFEELSWLQCKHVEGLRGAAQIARWLNQPSDAAEWESFAKLLEQRIIGLFWRDDTGFLHTLNQVTPRGNPYLPERGGHYQQSYVEKLGDGPSGPSRHCNALAVLAGIGSPAMKQTMLNRVFRSTALPPIITAYFRYYESLARAECGDPAGALLSMRDYIDNMIETEDAATIWEVYDPEVTDHRKYFSHFELTWDWPLSLCHGWGSGLVGLTRRGLLGIEPLGPGYSTVGQLDLPPAYCDFTATIPTPNGPIQIEATQGEPPRYTLPASIHVIPPT